MKIFKVILLIFLISKVSIGTSMASIVSSNCSSSHTELVSEQVSEDSSSDQEEEENGCCSGTTCNCACCSHIFLAIDQSQTKISAIQNFTLITFSYHNLYSFSSQNPIWQPPKYL